MFGNREFRVQVVKKDKDGVTDDNSTQITTEDVKNLMGEVMKCVGLYIAMDTARKVMITLASK